MAKRRTDFDDDLQPWDRQQDESERAYKAFRAYLDLGESRSMRKAWVEYVSASRRERAASGSVQGTSQESTRPGPNVGPSFKMWAKAFDWRNRALEWDRHVERQRQKEKIKEIQKLRDQHMRQASNLLAILDLPAITLAKKVRANPQALDNEAVTELFRMTAIAARRIPALQRAAILAAVGGDGQTPNVFEETTEMAEDNSFTLVVPPPTDDVKPATDEDGD